MTRLLCALAITAGLSGCRVQRSWAATIDMQPAETRDVWVGTTADLILQGSDTDNCSATMVGFDEGIAVTMLENDGWQGECWALLQITAPGQDGTRNQATVEFLFDICHEVGGECPPEYADSTEQFVLTVRTP